VQLYKCLRGTLYSYGLSRKTHMTYMDIQHSVDAHYRIILTSAVRLRLLLGAVQDQFEGWGIRLLLARSIHLRFGTFPYVAISQVSFRMDIAKRDSQQRCHPCWQLLLSFSPSTAVFTLARSSCVRVQVHCISQSIPIKSLHLKEPFIFNKKGKDVQQ